MQIYIGVDIGATDIKSVILNENYEIIDTLKIKTEQSEKAIYRF